MTNIDAIIDYEEGNLNGAETLELFSALVSNGMAWQLQGHYGRTAKAFIDAGYLNEEGEILKEIE